MAYLVANNTLTSTRSSVMEILVIIVAIVGVGVTVVIVAVGVVVAAGVVVESSSVVKLFDCCHLRLALEYAWLLDPLTFGLC
ncbi:hypothetical protein Tco_1232666 [Tanacetum coccineum]